MDLHRLAEERSLAYHRAVADLVRRDPRILERARERVHAWLSEGRVPHYAREWERVLARSLDSICEVLVADDEQARALRQSTPFAGALDPRERWRIWKAERRRVESA
jgi:hypothetical protein